VLRFGVLLRPKSLNGAKTGALVLAAMVADAVMDWSLNVRTSDKSLSFAGHPVKSGPTWPASLAQHTPLVATRSASLQHPARPVRRLPGMSWLDHLRLSQNHQSHAPARQLAVRGCGDCGDDSGDQVPAIYDKCALMPAGY
jgi:hypothetical protein